MKTNKKSFFITILSVLIVLLSSIALNITELQARIYNIDYANYPKNFSVYNLLNIDNYEAFMSNNFFGLEYKVYYHSYEKVTTNLLNDDLKIQVLGCESKFESFPLPSTYSDSINVTKVKSGESFTDKDILQKTNVMMMYNAHLKKIGYQEGDYIVINGIKFYLKGVLLDNEDIKRNIDENIIQVLIPASTYATIFNHINVKTVIKTFNYRFDYLDNDVNFVSQRKIDMKINTTKDYLFSTSLPLIIVLFLVAFISISIVQIILVRERYNEIGIRRAVGASKDDIVFLFTKSTLIKAIKGIIVGLMIYFIAFSFIQLLCSQIYMANLFVYNIGIILLFATIYLCVSFLTIIVTSFIGSQINIISVLVEEN